jgi:hypothetical protein
MKPTIITTLIQRNVMRALPPGPIYENRYTSLIGNLPRVYFVQPKHERSQTRHTASTRCPKNLHRLKA